jgi:hypothetical protein
MDLLCAGVKLQNEKKVSDYNFIKTGARFVQLK